MLVHAGLKSEGVIPRNQFLDENGDFTLSVGDQVRVAMETVDDGWGETRLSREKARRAESWQMLEKAFETSEVVKGLLNGKVKGGFTVDIERHPRLPPWFPRGHPPACAKPPTSKAVAWTSRSSSWINAATTSSSPAARCSKKRTAPSAKPCSPPCRRGSR